MGEYDSPKRHLPWDLLHPLVGHRTTEDDGECEPSSFVWPEDSDERVLVPFMLSLNEYNVLANAIDVGSDIAYGEDALRVTWLWLRNMRCQVDLCAMIAACINDLDSPARQAIKDLVMSDPDINDYFSETVQRLTWPQIEGGIQRGDCDNSVVAGEIVAIVEKLNLINTDALQIIELGTNDEEKIAAVLEGIPVLGELPIGDILDFAQDLLEDFFENYEAAVTEEWKDDVEEDLYCLAKSKDDCSLTYRDLFEYFQDRAGSSLTVESLALDVVNFIRTGDFSTDELIASGMYAVQLALVLVGKEFFGMNLPRIGAITRDALPSSKWEDWDDCEEPPPAGDCLDFTTDQYDWLPFIGRGIYYPGEGLGPLGPLDGYVFYWAGTSAEDVPMEQVVIHGNIATTGWRLLSNSSGAELARYEGAATVSPTFNESNATGDWPFEGILGWRIIPISEAVPAGYRVSEICFFPAP